ncbi:MAG: family 20 glycosylhydrolase [Bacteroidota bacterium]
MKKLKFLTTLLLVLSIIISCTKDGNKMVEIDKISILPKPQSLEVGTEKFDFSTNTKILINNDFKEFSAVADYLTDYLNEVYQLDIKKSNENTDSEPMISLLIKDDFENDEAYSLTIDETGIKVEGKTPRAIFYGIQSLIQIFPAGKQKVDGFKIPYVTINDYPQFKWRGMHLDVCRHFFPVEFVKKTIDLLVSLKMNTFHWHLTEDQGWRIEIKKYPKLTEVGAWRKETVIGHMVEHPLEFDGKKHGGFYTQEQIKEVVNYAQSRFITVIPEIELPGHAVAALAAYPEFSCTGGPFEVFTEWGVSEEVFCAGKDETFEFLENILSEVVELFPGEYFHIGGDECPKTRWKECNDCQARIKNEGLKDEHELQSYFIKRIEKFLHSKGKKLIGWDEILEGGLPARAAVMSWRGESGGIEAANEGHYVVMSPNATNYFDHYQGKYNEPLAIGGLTDMKEIYDYQPIPKELDEDKKHFVLGSQANLWSEYILNDDHMEYMIFPRICAMAENLWTDENNQGWDGFIQRMDAEYPRLDQWGINYRVNPPMGYEDINRFFADSVGLELNCNIPSAEIRYTLDGSEPNNNSILYTGSFTIQLDKKTTLKSKTFMVGGKTSSTMTGTFEKLELIEALTDKNPKNGVKYHYVKTEAKSAKNLGSIELADQGIINNFNIPEKVQAHHFGLLYFGVINIPADGVYTFHLSSDDGSVLYIDEKLVADNDGFHWNETKSGKIALKKGLHPIQLNYFQGKYGYALKLEVEGPGMEKQTIPDEMLGHK